MNIRKYSLLLLLFTMSCKNSSTSYDFEQFMEPVVVDSATDSANKQLELNLISVTKTKFDDADLIKLQEQIEESRTARSLKLLNEFSVPEERVDIDKVQVFNRGKEFFLISVTTINEETLETNELIFQSGDLLENNLVKFRLDKGSNDHDIKVRGFCILKEESVCKNLVFEVSYPLNGRQILRQFSFKPPEDIKADSRESDGSVFDNDKDESSFVADLSESQPVVQTEIESLKSGDLSEMDRIDIAHIDVSDSPNQQSAPAKPVFDPSAEVDFHIDKDVGEAAVKEANQAEQNLQDESGLSSSNRPKVRPVKLEEKVGLTSSLRPVARPSVKEIAVIENVQIIDGEDTAVSAGIYILPDDEGLDRAQTLHIRDLGVEVSSYSDLDNEESSIVANSSRFDSILETLKDKTYNQSKGGYGDSLGTGWIVDSSALKRGNDSVEPNRSDKKYGSGLTIDFLTWIGKVYLDKYRNDSICVNHISAKHGGEIGHKSHENGLDIDMSIPSSAVDCKSRGLKKYTSYYRDDEDFFEKNYDLLNMMISTGKVHVVFVDKSFIKKMCEYTKKLDLTSEQKEVRSEIFQKLYHVGGHVNHYHVRMKCNEQNLGCKSQGRLRPNVRTDCN